MKHIRLAIILQLASSLFCSGQQREMYHGTWIDLNKNGKKDVYEDKSQPVENRIADLLSKMTLDEKTAQLATLYGYGRVLKDELPTSAWKSSQWKDGIANIDEHLNSLPYNEKAKSQYSFPYSKHATAINMVQKWFIEETRMGIPVDFTNEGIHGLNHDRATLLPAPIAIGSTWDKALVHRAGNVVGREAKALGYTNVYVPILDVARDPRWGRIVETYGEDPFLIAEMGKQMVLGVQEQGVASTLKHFAVYSVPKGGRDGNARTDPHVAPRELQDIFLYPFRRVIKEARPLGVMSSYNDWDGIPITASHYFLTDLLRTEYGFKGYVVSDSRAVEFIATKHHVAKDIKDAVKQSIEAGLNVRTDFTMPYDYILPARELVNEGTISQELLDARVADVLRVKFLLGLFDEPYVKDPAAADNTVNNAEARDLNNTLTHEALVLLKNENNTLPLDKKKIRSILITGPLAADTTHSISRYGPSNVHVVSVLEGFRNYLGADVKISYAKGCDLVDKNWPESELFPTPPDPKEQVEINQAVELARQSDIVVIALGENEKLVGESKSRTSLDLPGKQLNLLQALQATGKPVVLILINGRPLTINWPQRYTPAIIEAWFPGQQCGNALAETVFGAYNPGGKLPVTFPKSVGQIELNFPFKPGSQAGQPGDGPNGFGKTNVYGPLYPFGFGLSYTTFQYSELNISPKQQSPAGNIDVSVSVTNTGKRKGDEVVQLYLRDEVSSVTVYETVLRGFERISLNAGETKQIHFTLKPDDLSLLNREMKRVVEPGKFEIQIGSSSTDIRAKGEFEILADK